MLRFINLDSRTAKDVDLDYLLDLIDFGSFNRAIKNSDKPTVIASLTSKVRGHIRRAENTSVNKVRSLPTFISITEALAIILNDLGFNGCSSACDCNMIYKSLEDLSAYYGIKLLGGIVNAAYARVLMDSYSPEDDLLRLVRYARIHSGDALSTACCVINTFAKSHNTYAVEKDQSQQRNASELTNYCIYNILHLGLESGNRISSPADNTVIISSLINVIETGNPASARESAFYIVCHALSIVSKCKEHLADRETGARGLVTQEVLESPCTVNSVDMDKEGA